MNNKPTKSQTDNNKWTKSNFTEYTVDQIHEEDKKIQEELIKLEEQKKILVAEDKKMKETGHLNFWVVCLLAALEICFSCVVKYYVSF
jgi:hypothetical protein